MLSYGSSDILLSTPDRELLPRLEKLLSFAAQIWPLEIIFSFSFIGIHVDGLLRFRSDCAFANPVQLPLGIGLSRVHTAFGDFSAVG